MPTLKKPHHTYMLMRCNYFHHEQSLLPSLIETVFAPLLHVAGLAFISITLSLIATAACDSLIRSFAK